MELSIFLLKERETNSASLDYSMTGRKFTCASPHGEINLLNYYFFASLEPRSLIISV